jgi:hypothetical protein
MTEFINAAFIIFANNYIYASLASATDDKLDSEIVKTTMVDNIKKIVNSFDSIYDLCEQPNISNFIVNNSLRVTAI